VQEYDTTGHITVGHPRKMLGKFILRLNPWTVYLDNNVGKISSRKQNTIYNVSVFIKSY